MVQRAGDELSELESRQEPRLVKALEMVAPGTALREGIDNILHAQTGGLIIIGEPPMTDVSDYANHPDRTWSHGLDK